MKKYISLFIVGFVTFLTSCSNDDITISKTTNFTVNPSTVISTFSVGEEIAGELESFDTSCRLNVRLYIYDSDGILVKEFGNTYSNYAVQFKTSSLLPQGKYTAVAITNIDDVTDNIKYWEITGKENLEGMRITDAGYLGGPNKVLGVSVSSFDVGNDVVDLTMNVKPAGSMLTVRYYGYRSRVNSYPILKLHANKTMEYLEFDRSGSSEVIADNLNGSFEWLVDYLDASQFPAGYDYIYSYEYYLPMTNVGLQFFGAKNYDNLYSTDYSFGNTTTFSTQAGASYYAYLYLSNNPSTSFGKYTNTTRGVFEGEKGLLLSPINKKNKNGITKGQSLRIKDFI